ncbi:MAG TPA: HAMP domain-containing sensor histidine kinase [Acidimicrobiales bacterium]|nr:HAMP domain-containing sensor histidine kinase [Acidimicrobiales bacterium]
MAERPGRLDLRRGGVTARLVVAFVAVALAAVGLFAVLTVAVEARDVSGLARQQADDLAHAVAATAANDYRSQGAWRGIDLSDALAVTDAVGARVRITDRSGNAVVQSPDGEAPAEGTDRAQAPVVVDGQRVGRVELAIGSGGVGGADAHLRHALAVGLAGSAAAAALLAVGAAVVVAERITRSLRQLTTAARAMTAGRRDVRVGPLPGAARELAELGEAYDSMADAVAEEDRLRRSTAAHVAHELRTPAAIILASTEAMLDGVSAADPEALGSLRDEALRLAARIGDLEALAAAEAAGLGLRLQPTDLAEVAGRAADALAEQFAAAGVLLARDLSTAWVAGDPARLHQVVTNLLTNAVKFSPEGSPVRLTVGTVNHVAVLEVSDAGPGIDAAEVPHLFEPFWRGRAARGVAGSGIGLAVVAELVGAHGGRVGVVSTPGQGTSFRVSIPELRTGVPARP